MTKPQKDAIKTDGPIDEEWLGSVGFKYREPQRGQQFRHWKLRFQEWEDYGLYIETTMPGHLNREGQHVGADRGWFVWIGRDHTFLHVRHMHRKAEMIALVEALSGLPWTPDRIGNVPVAKAKPQQPIGR